MFLGVICANLVKVQQITSLSSPCNVSDSGLSEADKVDCLYRHVYRHSKTKYYFLQLAKSPVKGIIVSRFV